MSQLRLEFSAYDHVFVDAVLEYEETATEPEPEVELSVGRMPDDSDRWAVWMTIEIPEDADPAPSYTIELAVFGGFELAADSIPEDDAARLVAVNGGSILYSSAREYLLMLTSRGLNDAYMLPTLDFRERPFDLVSLDEDEELASDAGDE